MELEKFNSMVQFKDSYDKLFYICFYDEIGIVRIFDITNYFPTNIIKLVVIKLHPTIQIQKF